MRLEFDPAKSERNIRERDLSFERAAEFDFDSADYLIDERRDYGERALLLWVIWTGVCMCGVLWESGTASASSVFVKRI